MAPGYVIALCLEAAGAIGIVLAGVRLETEQRTRAAELARFLRSGQVPDAQPHRARPGGTRPGRPMAIGRATAASASIDPSDARLALRNAYGASAG